MTEQEWQQLKFIATQAATARQYFNSHGMRAHEFEARIHLEKIEFLLGLLHRDKRTLSND